MIPRIIHQTWKSEEIPERFRVFSQTWQDHNPAWDYRFWSDHDLLEFVATQYPEFLELFCSYGQGVQRADAGRYLLLHHFGGIYADMDAECCQSLEPIVPEDRVVFCHEARAHWEPAIRFRGFPFLLFNGVMASPAGHPFWVHLLKRMREVAESPDVLDATGPCLLTGSFLGYDARDTVRIEEAVFFNPVDAFGHSDFAAGHPECYAIHHWAGTWWERADHRWITRKRASLSRRYYRIKAQLTGGKRLDPGRARAAVSPAAIAAEPPSGDNIAILVPVRDGCQHIGGFLAAIEKLEIPAERLKLVFCEGDSSDDRQECLLRMIGPLRLRYRDVRVLRKEAGFRLDPSPRRRASAERTRLSGLARTRNFLIDEALDESDDWALWMDIEIWRFPQDVLGRMLDARAKIVVPNCVAKPGGRSFDRSSFTSRPFRRDHLYWRSIRNGLYDPLPNNPNRLLLSDLRHSDRVPLDGVGGSMLLVDANLHRGGLRFPEHPYDDLIDTEAFGRLANDCGITPVGLPRLEILHLP